MDLLLKDKVVVITGGARNIGKEMVLGFLREGAKVITTDRPGVVSDQEFFQGISESLRPNVRILNIDISTDAGCKEVCDTAIREFEKLDILVNSAAVHISQSPEAITDEGFDKVLHNTLRSTMYMTRAAFSIMQKNKKGRIVNISSAVVYAGNPNELLYSSAKAGVEASTRAFARLGAPDGITVNAIAPHLIMTGMGLETLAKDPTIPARIPLGRAGRVDELVNLVLYLSSEVAEYITGQVIPLNGGRLMR